jgi:enoyl-[acyl-carrier-protein] reductase (NADH)
MMLLQEDEDKVHHLGAPGIGKTSLAEAVAAAAEAAHQAGLMDRGARIFAMTSIGGSRAVPNYGPVSAAKATLEAHIRQLAVELAPAGITANAILAGVTDTNALRQIPDYEKIMEVARQRNPNRRLTRPEDVARCIAALCHPATYWLTGNTLHVDGGENIVG